MTRPDIDKDAENRRFDVAREAQKSKMNVAAEKHAGKIRGNTEANAGGQNRESGDRRARQNDRATNGGE